MVVLSVRTYFMFLLSTILFTFAHGFLSPLDERDTQSGENVSFLQTRSQVFVGRAGRELVENAIRKADTASIAKSLLEQEANLRLAASDRPVPATNDMSVPATSTQGENPTKWWPGRTEYNQAFNEAASAIGTNAKSDGTASGNGNQLYWLKNAPWFLPPPPEFGPVKQEMYSGYYNKPVHRSFELPNVMGKRSFDYLPNPAATEALTAPNPTTAPAPYLALTRPDAMAGVATSQTQMTTSGELYAGQPSNTLDQVGVAPSLSNPPSSADPNATPYSLAQQGVFQDTNAHAAYSSFQTNPSFLSTSQPQPDGQMMQPAQDVPAPMPSASNPSVLQTAASGAYPSLTSPPSRPVGPGTDGVYAEPFRGDYGSRFVQPMAYGSLVGPSHAVTEADPAANTRGDIPVDYGIYATSSREALAGAPPGSDPAGSQGEQGVDLYSSTLSPYSSQQLLANGPDPTQPPSLAPYAQQGATGPSYLANGAGAPQFQGYPAAAQQQQPSYSRGSLVNGPYSLQSQSQFMDPATAAAPSALAPPSAGQPREGSLMGLVNGEAGDGGYAEREQQMVNLAEGMREYPDSGLNNLGDPNRIMYAPGSAPYQNNGCNPNTPEACTKSTTPTPDDRNVSYGPYQAQWMPEQ